MEPLRVRQLTEFSRARRYKWKGSNPIVSMKNRLHKVRKYQGYIEISLTLEKASSASSLATFALVICRRHSSASAVVKQSNTSVCGRDDVLIRIGSGAAIVSP